MLAGCDSAVTESSADQTTVPTLQARATEPTTAEPVPQAIPTPSPAAPPAAPGASPGTAAPAPGPATCRTDGLDVTRGRTGGAAGSVILTLVFTNTSAAPCTLTGHPGVSYVGEDGATQVGAAAVGTGQQSGPVVLAPGAAASAQVRAAQVGNYPEQECRPTPVAGLRVYPPDNTASVVLPYSGTGCAAESPGITQLDVHPVVPGTDG